DQDSWRVVESCVIAGGTFSAQLVPTLAALRQRHGLKAGDLDGFAPISGPGSFTGLRVGLSAIKGLAEVLKNPIAPVSLLEALIMTSVAGSPRQGIIAAALDAGREQVFLGLYEFTKSQARKLSEQLLMQNEFLEALRNSHAARFVTNDHALATLASESGASLQEVERPGSEEAARIGLGKLLAGETMSVEDLDANYIRRS